MRSWLPLCRLAAGIAVTTAACAPRVAPAPPSVSQPMAIADTSPALSIPTDNRREFQFRAGQYSYGLLQTALLTIARDTLPSTVDTISIAGSVTYTVTGAELFQGLLRPSGAVLIDSLLLKSTLGDSGPTMRTLSSPALLTLPHQPLPPGADSASRNLSTACSELDTTARDIVQGLTLTMPAVIARGAVWTDSSTTHQCRNGFPIEMSALSRYQVDDIRDSAGIQLVQIRRTTTVLASGSATSGSRHITVQGAGDSQTLFVYDARGYLLQATGQASLSLTLQAGQHIDRATQQLTTSARLTGAPPMEH